MKIKIFGEICPSKFWREEVPLNTIEIFLKERNKSNCAVFFTYALLTQETFDIIKKLETKGIMFTSICQSTTYSGIGECKYSDETLFILKLLFNSENYIEFEV